MNARFLVISFLTVAAAAAHASFEMMLMAAGSGGIYRYDPQNNITLGKFGMAGAYYYDVALDPTRPGEAVAFSSYGTVDRYDYSTGEFRGGFSTAPFYSNVKPQVSVVSNGNVLVTTYLQTGSVGVTRLYSSTGTLLNTLQAFGSLYETMDAMETPDGTLHTLVRYNNGSNFSYFLFNYTAAGSYTGYATVASGVPEQFGNLSWVNNKLFITSSNNASNPSPMQSSTAPFTATSAITMNGYALINGATNWVGGHSGIGYMVHSYYSGSQYNRLYIYNPNNNQAGLTSVFIPISDQVLGSAIVTAPEPGSMLALGAGVAALLRKRRRKS